MKELTVHQKQALETLANEITFFAKELRSAKCYTHTSFRFMKEQPPIYNCVLFAAKVVSDTQIKLYVLPMYWDKEKKLQSRPGERREVIISVKRAIEIHRRLAADVDHWKNNSDNSEWIKRDDWPDFDVRIEHRAMLREKEQLFSDVL